MGEVKDYTKELYFKEGGTCSETMLGAPLLSRRGTMPDDYGRMMSGFSGGVSVENLCGALLGGVAAISALINKGDHDSFELSKETTAEFYRRFEEEIGSTNCHEIKEKWRKEDIRCYDVIQKTAEIMEEILQKYNV